MNKGRVVLAGLTGGIAMYIWTSLAHVVLPLGSIGVSEIPKDEPALIAAMQSSLGGASGFFIFPSTGSRPGDTSAQKADAMKNYDAKLAVNPSGILIYHPPGAKALAPGQLIAEFLSEMFCALLAVFLLSQTRLASYFAQVAFLTGVGILSAVPTNLSYWIWYSFPAPYTAAYISIQLAGFIVVGLVAAAFLKKRV